MEQIVFQASIKLEKFPGKGGWTYAKLPGLRSAGKWQKLRGQIDDLDIEEFSVMPFGNELHFTPVRSEIRKRIGKEAGDLVSIILYGEEEQEIDWEQEFMQCLEDDPQALFNYTKWSAEVRDLELENIRLPGSTDAKITRISSAMARIHANIPYRKPKP